VTKNTDVDHPIRTQNESTIVTHYDIFKFFQDFKYIIIAFFEFIRYAIYTSILHYSGDSEPLLHVAYSVNIAHYHIF
jgi:hypothetical protein